MDFGATIDGVKAFLPHWEFDEVSRPTLEQVQRQLANVTSDVHVELGSLVNLSGPMLEKVSTQARVCVELGTAAWVEDSMFPERADDENSTKYAAVLQSRYEKKVAKLAEIVQRGSDTADDPFPVPSAGVAWSQPSTPLGIELTLIPDFPNEVDLGAWTSASDLNDPAVEGVDL